MVADFGIAIAVSAAAGGRMTETGLSLGTPHYMSPEQATAEKNIDARSDTYSLGAVLYEMLSGDPPHVGASVQQIIMKIVSEDAAPVTKTRRSVPPNVAAVARMRGAPGIAHAGPRARFRDPFVVGPWLAALAAIVVAVVLAAAEALRGPHRDRGHRALARRQVADRQQLSEFVEAVPGAARFRLRARRPLPRGHRLQRQLPRLLARRPVGGLHVRRNRPDGGVRSLVSRPGDDGARVHRGRRPAPVVAIVSRDTLTALGGGVSNAGVFVSPDGKRVVYASPVSSAFQIFVAPNWSTEMRRRLAGAGGDGTH